MVKPEDTLQIIQLLESNDIPVWLVGGWGIDALLGYQSREHKDLDILLLRDDVVQVNKILKKAGFHLKELWSENSQVIDNHGNTIDTAYVLHHAEGIEIDAHAFHFEGDKVIPDWEDTERFQISRAGLDHTGFIACVQVRCITSQLQLLFHTGYDLPDYQVQDIRLLNEEYP
jgi:lincosamide nucleotidyltransferase A/C/D/E